MASSAARLATAAVLAKLSERSFTPSLGRRANGLICSTSRHCCCSCQALREEFHTQPWSPCQWPHLQHVSPLLLFLPSSPRGVSHPALVAVPMASSAARLATAAVLAKLSER